MYHGETSSDLKGYSPEIVFAKWVREIPDLLKGAHRK